MSGHNLCDQIKKIFLIVTLAISTFITFPSVSETILVTKSNSSINTESIIFEYTKTGESLSAVRVPYPIAGASNIEKAKGITIDKNGNLAVFNGDNFPYLSIFNTSTQLWEHKANNTPHQWTAGGAITSYQNYIFVNDVSGASDPALSGIFRFDINNNYSAEFFSIPLQALPDFPIYTGAFSDIVVGQNGYLYAAAGSVIGKIDPVSMVLIETIYLPIAGDIVVNKQGEIFVSGWTKIHHFSSRGEELNSIDIGITYLGGIDISTNGEIVVLSRFGDVILTDETLSSFTLFKIPGLLDPTGISFNNLSARLPNYAVVRGKLWYDTNINGIQDLGEPPITGETVSINDSFNGNVSTDINGEYEFKTLPGNYEIRFPFLYNTGYDHVTQQDQGINDTIDSDVDPVTEIISLPAIDYEQTHAHMDAGYFRLGKTSFLPLEDGNNWTYNVSTGGTDTHTVLPGFFTVGGSQAKRVRDSAGYDDLYFSGNPVRTFLGEYDEDAFPGVSDMLIEYEPGISIYGNGLGLGESSNISGNVYITGSGIVSETLSYTGTRNMVGYETITVPAGTFSTIKLIVDTTITGTIGGSPFNASEKATLWMAPDIGFVKIENLYDGVTETRELTSAFVDSDGDGVNVFSDNCRHVANASQVDTDSDGIGNECDEDDDADNLSDTLEVTIGTNPLVADSDGDGLNDGVEVGYDGDKTTYTPGQDLNPLSTDTDGDGFSDAIEVAAGTNPLDIADYPVQADGDLNADSIVNTADVIIVRKILFGEIAPTPYQLDHADVAPLVSGVPVPDGQITAGDLLLIQRKALGEINF